MSSQSDSIVRSDSPTVMTRGLTTSTEGSSEFSDSPTSAFPPIIPAEPRAGRTLVMCFDGTGDQFDLDNSNIVELFSMLKKDDRSKQMVYYQAGIGTSTHPLLVTPMVQKFSKSLDEAIAWNLHTHVMEGYEFLMQNYTMGDRICIFGFSRGAYTARSLAGMIHKIGVLPACNHQQVPFAYKMFTDESHEGWHQSNAFKRTFSIDVDIEFLGVWDTVNSVGLIPRRLPFTKSNTIVRTFRHAIALDERRAKFQPASWKVATPEEENLSASDQERKKKKEKKQQAAIAAAASGSTDSTKNQKKMLKLHERMFSRDSKDGPTDVEEVWFAGAHCDVGGGSVPNDTPHSLAAIALRWMVRECFKTETGILFDSERLRDIGLDPASLWPRVQERPPAIDIDPEQHIIENIPKQVKVTANHNHEIVVAPNKAVLRNLKEEEIELRDALAPIYDQLTSRWWFWSFLELWPTKVKKQLRPATWIKYMPNWGRGREIPKARKGAVIKVHRSVKLRMQAKHQDSTPYVPKAFFEEKNVEWIS